MKKTTYVIAMAVLVISLQSYASGQSPDSMADTDKQLADSVSYQQFYDALSPYGRWIDYPGYGYVWSPNIADFRPYYTDGYWVSTDLGWCWNSGYNWGWAPFHYGRWFYETGYGWLWLPGYQWAPSWVMWRTSPDYYGWAPLPPGPNIGISVSVTIPFEHWTFVDHRYITARDFRPYAIDERKTEIIYKNTTIINNFVRAKNNVYYAKGPDVKEVERFTGQRIAPVAIREFQRPVASQIDINKKELRVFKPAIRQRKDNEVFKPVHTIPYSSLPHDNGRRGTWAMPEAYPMQKRAFQIHHEGRM